jgi:hypothetical protein
MRSALETFTDAAAYASTDAPMADLIRTLESDLFGGYEWAAEFYEDFKGVPEPTDRLAVYRGLMRSYEALEGKADDSMRAAEGIVQAEDELDDVERAVLAPLEGPRDALFAEPTIETARAFLAAFDAAWQKGEHAAKQALVPDAILAALANSNVVASLGRKTLPTDEVKRYHARAAVLYEELFAMLTFRIGTGESVWKETTQSALFRAAAAWRLAGDEQKAKRAAEIAGPVPDAAALEGRGLRKGG